MVDERPPDGVDGAVVVLRAMAYEHRLRILVHLLDRDATAAALSEALPLEASCLAHHLRQLRAAHLIRRHRHGRQIVYRLGDEPTRHLVTEVMSYVTPPVTDALR